MDQSIPIGSWLPTGDQFTPSLDRYWVGGMEVVSR